MMFYSNLFKFRMVQLKASKKRFVIAIPSFKFRMVQLKVSKRISFVRCTDV